MKSGRRNIHFTSMEDKNKDTNNIIKIYVEKKETNSFRNNYEIIKRSAVINKRMLTNQNSSPRNKTMKQIKYIKRRFSSQLSKNVNSTIWESFPNRNNKSIYEDLLLRKTQQNIINLIKKRNSFLKSNFDNFNKNSNIYRNRKYSTKRENINISIRKVIKPIMNMKKMKNIGHVYATRNLCKFPRIDINLIKQRASLHHI